MAPRGLAILLGAGPTTGAGIARILADPAQGNLAVALLARRPESLQELSSSLKSQVPNATIETFATDTSPDQLKSAFDAIKSHQSFSGLKLALSIFSIKHSHKTPFLQETHEQFTQSLRTYVGGAYTFAHLSLSRFMSDHGSSPLSEGAPKKGTLIFTGTLGALRCSAEFAAYGAGRASVRQLAQSLAREFSAQGVHVAHTVINGGVRDEESEEVQKGSKIRAESVGRTYLWLEGQGVDCWTHELDLRPAQEKF